MAGSVKSEEHDTIIGSLSSLVQWLQEASNPSRRADMLRTLTVSSSSVHVTVTAIILSFHKGC